MVLVMKRSSKKFFLAVAFLALSAPALAETSRHDGGDGTFSLSGGRRSAVSGSKKLSDAVNACLLGRAGSNPLLGINPGLGEVGQGIGTDPRPGFPFPGIDDGALPEVKPIDADAKSLAPEKCLKCHGPKDAQASIDALQGKKRVPAKMQTFLDGLSATEKADMVAFFEKRKSEGK